MPNTQLQFHYDVFIITKLLGVYISQDGMTIQNNSNVTFMDIPIDGVSEYQYDFDDGTGKGDPLVCHSDSRDYELCAQGDWYLPDGSSVILDNDAFTVINQTLKCAVDLYRTESGNLESYLETLCCIIPDINGINQTVCINTG